uniref:DAN domain-containing protein n=1 Tax=Ciona savignyi TaxID=51511 RepID=H2YAT8_CIOSA
MNTVNHFVMGNKVELPKCEELCVRGRSTSAITLFRVFICFTFAATVVESSSIERTLFLNNLMHRFSNSEQFPPTARSMQAEDLIIPQAEYDLSEKVLKRSTRSTHTDYESHPRREASGNNGFNHCDSCKLARKKTVYIPEAVEGCDRPRVVYRRCHGFCSTSEVAEVNGGFVRNHSVCAPSFTVTRRLPYNNCVDGVRRFFTRNSPREMCLHGV